MSSQESLDEQLVSAIRTTIGDGLRSVVRFDREDWGTCYIREDVARSVGGRDALQGWFVENERLGSESAAAYREYADADDVEPAFGAYELTVRVFEDGLVGRVIVGNRGVLFTTDRMALRNVEDAGVAARNVLA
jgi:hypothetical protein